MSDPRAETRTTSREIHHLTIHYGEHQETYTYVRQLDQLVKLLYALTPDEIRIVEKSTP